MSRRELGDRRGVRPHDVLEHRLARMLSLVCVALVSSGCPSDLGPITATEVDVTVTSSGDGNGLVVNETQVEEQTFEISCVVLATDTSGSGCSADFRDADGAGTIVLTGTPDPGSGLESWGGDCAADTHDVCRLSFSALDRVQGRIELEAEVIFSLRKPSVVTLTPPTSLLTEVGQTVTLTGTLLDQFDGELDPSLLSWSSAAPDVVQVTGSGATAVATALAGGSAEITAAHPTATGVEGKATVTVELPTASTLVIYDPMDEPGRWTETIRSDEGGTSSTATHPADGGAQGGYRRIVHDFPGAGQINVFHGYTARTYDPSTEGAIASLDYSEARKKIEPVGTGSVGATFAVVQGGVTYAIAGEAFDEEDWTEWAVTGLGPEDFTPAPGPDFSAAGGPITFGVIRSNTRGTATPLQVVHGLDEFRIVIHRAP